MLTEEETIGYGCGVFQNTFTRNGATYLSGNTVQTNRTTCMGISLFVFIHLKQKGKK